MLFGIRRLVLEHGCGSYSVKLWGIGRTRRFDLNVWADAVFLVGMVSSMWLLSLSLRTIPLGTAYAVWTGVGAVGGFVAGIVMFGESASALRIVTAAIIVAGIVGLKLAT